MTPCLVEDRKWKNIAAADTGSTCAESNDIVGRKEEMIFFRPRILSGPKGIISRRLWVLGEDESDGNAGM